MNYYYVCDNSFFFLSLSPPFLTFFSFFTFPLNYMTHSSSTYNTPRQNKPPDPITTTGLSKGSLNSSSTLSVSPSASVLLSSSSRPSRNNNRSSKTPTSTTATIIPQQSTSSVSSNNRNTKLEQIIQVRYKKTRVIFTFYLYKAFLFQNFYTKTAQIIIQSRISNERLSGGKRKINKWVLGMKQKL